MTEGNRHEEDAYAAVNMTADKHMHLQVGLSADDIAVTTGSSVSNGSGPSLRVLVRVHPEPLPQWVSRLTMNPNCQLGYSAMVNPQPV